jgi:hypothetical protein
VSDPPPAATLSANEHVAFVEERRKSAEAVLWQLPSVSIAAQSFLLAAGLNPKAEDWVRDLVGALGAFTALATLLVVAHQAIRLTVLTRWVHGRLDQTVSAEALGTGGGVQLNRFQKWLLSVKGALEIWIVVLLAFVGADIYVLTR